MTVDQAMQTAIAHHQAGRLAQAEQIYRQILAGQPNHVDALHLLGVLAGQVGQYTVAIDLIKDAIALKPDHFEALSNLGNFLTASGRCEEAAVACNRAIQINPGFADAYNNLGHSLIELKRFNEAAAACSRAIQLNPRCAGAYSNLGNSLRELDRPQESLDAFDHALSLIPNSAQTLNSRGLTLARLGQRDDAIATFRHALLLDPKLAMAYNNLAQELNAMHRHDESDAAFRKAIALKPDGDIIHWNFALSLLARGELLRGWEEYELGKHALWPRRNFATPQWTGQDPRGKTILIHQDDCGHGDYIQFIRYIPLLKNLSPNLIVECRPEMAPIIADMPGVDALIPRGEQPAHYDFHIALRSLPRIFKTDLTNIPNSVPYLKVPDKYAGRWRPRIAGGGFKVGLVWSGASQSRMSDRQRIRSADLLAALSKLKHIRYFSLQKEAAAPPPRNLQIVDFAADLEDFADTAAVIDCLDLVISIDTSVAHLAGALARPVWLLLAHQADFRWLRDRTDSPWYPTMRLFRQTSPEDRSSPISSVVNALKEISR